MEDGKILEVEGLYYVFEIVLDGYDNMGFVCVVKIIDLLVEYILRDCMWLVVCLVGDNLEDVEGYFFVVGICWVVDDFIVNFDEEEVISIFEDEKIILFLNVFVEEICVEEVINYFNDLVEYFKVNFDDWVCVIGYVLCVGDLEENMMYSCCCVCWVKDMFILCGVFEG